MRLLRVTRRLPLLLFASMPTLGCAPDLGEPPSRVSDDRVLAIRANFPETPLGAAVTYDALVVGPGGRRPTGDARWAFCHAPKPLAENNVVPSACLGSAVVRIGHGSTVTAPTPTDACSLFGSDLPPGASGLRPRDPDETGGYYQPVRLELDGLVAFDLERIVCNLANAPSDLASQWLHAYHPNQNPTIAALTASMDGETIDIAHLPRGARVTFRLSWSVASKESYAWFDAAHQKVVTRDESLDVSWFSTGGDFDADRTGRAENEAENFVEVGFVAPKDAERGSVVTVWAVLRDSRGGLDWIEAKAGVE